MKPVRRHDGVAYSLDLAQKNISQSGNDGVLLHTACSALALQLEPCIPNV